MVNCLPAIFTNREKKLVSFLREMSWGEVRIRVENGQPVLIYEAVRTFRLEEGEAKEKQRPKREQA
ncbi:MAG: hypothetical protein IBX71_06375 [Candidatus Desulforudis sp.]|nr:hypothetical protein [Desulforudis sp.]